MGGDRPSLPSSALWVFTHAARRNALRLSMTSLGWGLSAWTRVVSGSMSSVEVGHNVRGQRCRQGRHCGLSVGREGFDSAPRATSLPFAALRAGFSSGATSRRFAPPSRLRSQAGRSLRREGGTRDVSDEVEVGSADKPAALSVRAAWFARLNSRLPGSHSFRAPCFAWLSAVVGGC